MSNPTGYTGQGNANAYPQYGYYQNQPPTQSNPPYASHPQANYSSQNVITPSSGPTRTNRRSGSNLKGVFAKDLKSLMYGFGDEFHVAPDTVGVMEEILIEYIGNLCTAALGPSKKARLQTEDLRRVLARPADGKKLARMEELLFMQEDIKRARQQFEDGPMSNA